MAMAFRRILSPGAIRSQYQFYSESARWSAEKRDLLKYFQYKRAIVCNGVSNSYATSSIRMDEPGTPIDIAKAKADHNEYVNHLKRVPLRVFQIPVENNTYPDQVFVEDPAVIYDGKAVITNMKMPSRYGEREAMKAIIETIGGLPIFVMPNSPEAYLDGGDVLFTGREFLIGLSSRTSKKGIEEFAKFFPNWPITGIKVAEGSGVLHLKSMSSMCGIDTIAIGDSNAGRQAWKEIDSKASFKYTRIGFPDDNGANCLFINGVVMHPSEEDYPESYKIWRSLECEKISIPNSEFTKADGSLTCRSILIN